MRRFLASVALMMFALAVTLPTSAGDKKKDVRPELKVLEGLVGKFDAKVKMYFPDPTKPTESTGSLSRKLILDGNFLQESFKGEFVGKPYEGKGVVGFDINKKKYVTTWIDTMSTSIAVMEGTWNADAKTLTTTGEEFDPMGKKKVKMRDVLKVVSADEQTFEMFRQPEGEAKEFKIMEITYKRKAAKK